MLSIDDLSSHGTGLSRPECVLAHQSGLLFAPCWLGKGGVSVIAPSGSTSHILATDPFEPLKPNGIALEDGGSFLLAHLGTTRGALVRLFPDGRTETLSTSVDNAPMPPANFVTIDAKGRIWMTVSTRVTPRSDDYRKTASTGFIAVHENGATRIVADGLGYTNEIALAADGKTLWVNETFARKTTAFDLSETGALSNKRTVAEYGPGTFPDGIALDAEGGLWITSIVSNRVLHVAPDGTIETILEDSDPAHLAWVEAAFQSNSMDRRHLDRAISKRLQNISNLAFGGPDMQQAFLGCLVGDEIASFKSSVFGLPTVYWAAKLGPIASYLEA